MLCSYARINAVIAAAENRMVAGEGGMSTARQDMDWINKDIAKKTEELQNSQHGGRTNLQMLTAQLKILGTVLIA